MHVLDWPDSWNSLAQLFPIFHAVLPRALNNSLALMNDPFIFPTYRMRLSSFNDLTSASISLWSLRSSFSRIKNSNFSDEILLGYLFIKKSPEYFISIKKNSYKNVIKYFNALKYIYPFSYAFLKYIHETLKVSLGFN